MRVGGVEFQASDRLPGRSEVLKTPNFPNGFGMTLRAQLPCEAEFAAWVGENANSVIDMVRDRGALVVAGMEQRVTTGFQQFPSEFDAWPLPWHFDGDYLAEIHLQVLSHVGEVKRAASTAACDADDLRLAMHRAAKEVCGTGIFQNDLVLEGSIGEILDGPDAIRPFVINKLAAALSSLFQGGNRLIFSFLENFWSRVDRILGQRSYTHRWWEMPGSKLFFANDPRNLAVAHQRVPVSEAEVLPAEFYGKFM